MVTEKEAKKQKSVNFCTRLALSTTIRKVNLLQKLIKHYVRVWKRRCRRLNAPAEYHEDGSEHHRLLPELEHISACRSQNSLKRLFSITCWTAALQVTQQRAHTDITVSLLMQIDKYCIYRSVCGSSSHLSPLCVSLLSWSACYSPTGCCSYCQSFSFSVYSASNLSDPL